MKNVEHNCKLHKIMLSWNKIVSLFSRRLMVPLQFPIYYHNLSIEESCRVSKRYSGYSFPFTPLLIYLHQNRNIIIHSKLFVQLNNKLVVPNFLQHKKTLKNKTLSNRKFGQCLDLCPSSLHGGHAKQLQLNSKNQYFNLAKHTH